MVFRDQQPSVDFLQVDAAAHLVAMARLPVEQAKGRRGQ
jgi:hypothetical protein|tara:strand:- start:1081 stop:1197 length:117 start_codon:yes stop_codon:yes gene_type:complete